MSHSPPYFEPGGETGSTSRHVSENLLYEEMSSKKVESTEAQSGKNRFHTWGESTTQPGGRTVRVLSNFRSIPMQRKVGSNVPHE